MTTRKLFILNEKSGRYVTTDGAIGRKIIKEKHEKKQHLQYFQNLGHKQRL